jgi:hypothetical protein
LLNGWLVSDDSLIVQIDRIVSQITPFSNGFIVPVDSFCVFTYAIIIPFSPLLIFCLMLGFYRHYFGCLQKYARRSESLHLCSHSHFPGIFTGIFGIIPYCHDSALRRIASMVKICAF